MAEFISNNNYVSSEKDVLPSRIKHFVNDFTAELELRAARVAGGHAPEGDIERQFHSILQTTREQSPQRYVRLKKKLTAPLEHHKRNDRYKAFAHIDVNESGALDTVDLAARHMNTVSPFASSWVHIPPAVDGLLKPDRLRDDLIPQAGYKGLKFYVSKVKCIEETDEWGSDEIYLGTNFVDETGDASYKWFRVSDDFDTGEVKSYGFPGKELQYFNITEAGNKFPKIYTTVLTMVEEDWGSISESFKDLFAVVKKYVKGLLKKLGYAVGELFGLGALGGLVGNIFAAIFEWLWRFFFLWENDYMGSFITKAVINSYSGNWVATGGPTYSWSKGFKAHGGHYHVWYAWELVK